MGGHLQGGRVAVKIINCQEGQTMATGGSLGSTEAAGGSHEACSRAGVVEALLARCLSHPHIVTTFSYGVSACQQVRGGQPALQSCRRGFKQWCNVPLLACGIAKCTPCPD